MSKFKIEHGASRINLVLLKTSIEDTISNDLDLLTNWSNNDRKYIVNELLRFALTQEEDFQKYKATLSRTSSPLANMKPVPTPAKPAMDAMPKADPSGAVYTARG